MDEQSQNAALTIHGQFIKDLSLEIPHAPEIFSEIKSAPKMDVHVDVKSEPKGNGMFTSQLDISMTGKVEDKTLFVLELSYMAFAEVKVPEEHLEPILMVELPRLIFPFARNVITHCLTEGGLPPFMLNPIDFGALYMARKQAMANKEKSN
ncbi:MAG: protein-export chaperone SecB [Alphaproteobacteria bacterium]|nr:protein-export chaperone SecB [Alphaproteobacteria bacterium]